MDYKAIYKKAAKDGGWSKEKLDLTTKWGDFYELVKGKLKRDEVVLDIGTAEGNNFIRLAPEIKKGVGIDIEPAMIRLANKNRKSRRIRNIVFKCMDAKRLKFPANNFNVITVKHSPIDFREAYRVLKVSGRLITQQVHELDKLNLKRAFKRGQDFDKKPGHLLGKYVRAARKAGFKIVKEQISNIPYYFNSKGTLIRFLNKTPTIPDFDSKKDLLVLEEFIRKNKTIRGIKSNTSRFLLELEK